VVELILFMDYFFIKFNSLLLQVLELTLLNLILRFELFDLPIQLFFFCSVLILLSLELLHYILLRLQFFEKLFLIADKLLDFILEVALLLVELVRHFLQLRILFRDGILESLSDGRLLLHVLFQLLFHLFIRKSMITLVADLV